VKLVWTDLAMADRRAIYDRIDAINARAAMELDERFASTAEHLRNHPEMGRVGRIPGTRELIAHRSYFLLYEIVNDTVLIIAVMPTSRPWPPIWPLQ
jgi:toxin ParE1/3/4